MDRNTATKGLTLIYIFNKVLKKWKIFAIILPAVFILSCIYILSVPRYYSTDIKLAPEIDNPMAGGALGSLVSSFGIDLSNMENNDAITPLLYPDLMEDNKFVANLFSVEVENSDKSIRAKYFDYLEKHQKHSWWQNFTGSIKSLFASEEQKGGSKEFNPYNLTKSQYKIAGAVRSKVKLNVNKKTGVITINVTDQDPIISKTIADSTKSLLQKFITEYRTNKARTDYEYYKNLASTAKREYEKARQKYGSYADANTEVVLESFRAKQNDLENDMQLKYNTYTTINTQLQAARAKVQERTPVFTVLKGAAIPVKPAGPKRMIFVIAMVFLAFFVTVLYIIKDDLLYQLKA